MVVRSRFLQLLVIIQTVGWIVLYLSKITRIDVKIPDIFKVLLFDLLVIYVVSMRKRKEAISNTQ